MEVDTITAKKSFAGNIKTDFSSLGFDLSTLILNMKDNDDWKSGELNSFVLLNSSAKKIVLTVIHNRTEVNSFQSGDSVAIQIIEGKIKFHSALEAIELRAGQRLVLHDKIEFRLTSLEESSFILTITADSLKSKDN